eukprot:CAMPEP_0172440204 /NCGR_PEP_ID=MMETSP1065-20121228/917_1 /TAXON_ID=265537 /ORGANISM="Amphiprora paludosa, Strain CCMP125" /LENGTH=427 /DNA_ID=CAMNT_0013188989 /DNA_START=18 /DNA_END=1301 /DNA_ORIENTATION=+
MVSRSIVAQGVFGLFIGALVLKITDMQTGFLGGKDGSPGIFRTGSYLNHTTNSSEYYDPDEWSDHVWKNKYDLVHVFQTDFLQYQQDLVNLGKARLDLFETFTLPSMLQQTNKQWLWMMYVDPNLNPEFKGHLLSLVENIPNIVVMAHHRVEKEDFRSLHGMDLNTVGDHILAGDARLLIDYYRAAQSHVLIETRLDADDALSHHFAESMQGQAASTIGLSTDTMDYRVYCAENHIEWRYYPPNETTGDSYVVHYHNPEFCVNSGLTIGYQLDARERHLIHTEQCYFAFWMDSCGDRPMQIYYENGRQKHRCLARIFMPDQSDQVVLMARTPTAAGMKHVLGTGTDTPYQDTYESHEKQKEAWNMIQKDFSITRQKVVELKHRMEKNIENILHEALLGQCTKHHSCKDSSKKKLGKLLEEAQTRNRG